MYVSVGFADHPRGMLLEKVRILEKMPIPAFGPYDGNSRRFILSYGLLNEREQYRAAAPTET
jgi:hypothetical protein